MGSDSQDITVAIMAGGKSSRMGTDKAFVPIFGKPMVEHVLSKVNNLADEKLIIANDAEQYSYLGLPVHSDIYPNLGPLAGLHTALTNASNPYTLVVACDMPWLNKQLLEHLLSLRTMADVIVPRWDKFPEPLHAVYSKTCLEHIEQNLKLGILKMISFYSSVSVRFVNRDEIQRYDSSGQSFANINSPQDLRLAEYRRNQANQKG